MHDSGHILIPIPIPAFYKSLIPIPGKSPRFRFRFWFQPNLILLIPIPIPADMWLIPESIPILESELCITGYTRLGTILSPAEGLRTNFFQTIWLSEACTSKW